VQLRFGDFVVDSETRQVLRDQEEIHLSPKAFDLLCTLAERRPTVVDKAELTRRIWPDTFVGDANLNVLIGEIRRALGDTAQRPRFIRTVHGVGYAFCGEVAELSRSTTVRRPAATRSWLVWNDRTFALAEGDNLIGRDPGCNIWLDESGVSRRHARINVDGVRRRMTLEDLNSTNGTFVGDAQLNAKHALTDGEVIHIGSVALTFRAWFPETSRETERIRRKPRVK
jgi:DNA-binding winged helix-turn-helix (wHTH) protein